MAPKQKATEVGGNSNAGGKSGNHSNDHKGNSERGQGHANGNLAAERGGSGSSGLGGSDRPASTAGGISGDKEKNPSSGSGASVKRRAEAPLITVEFADMDIAALRRYCRLNKLKPKSKSRDDLAAAATKHWNTITAKEVDSVAYFLFAVKHRHNTLKLTMPLP
ncbi:hypothetical protein BX616_005514 [Lobosporangium transversale]|uniref:Histone deacetylase complex subunit SAP30 Sin3 binding domain-containing protein n=1 Tax=Lobosporangium transversale TaxID=64571 RepID=A0A1Y2H313_9FUNG|nr:hypothetical protein BCR41DRAFT_382838 [Lobosporangium transversale]KAF9897487.1 hypothetical protein BX616_005514 [Lobosporangium transversale]ORZ28938.1 hypothetical protein BCR41DRAFT_382838 [Lobosporangium transversale]|eukprot:XP_021886611.1 hypothetical protein BCR41DRAFT_382838 [Lobosporangium transversale]